MKSGKQRRLEIKERRRKKAEKLVINTSVAVHPLPVGAVEADHAELSHNNTCGLLPLFYIDISFTCRDCDAEELWTAKQQKWWYEIAKGNIYSTAVHCRECRIKIKNKKKIQKLHMEEMAKVKPHPNEAFFKKKYE